MDKEEIDRVRNGTGRLEGAVLDNAQLVAADLSNFSLVKTSFKEADLENANLSQSDLSETKFNKANLRKADLHDSILYKADLSEADLTDADLRGAALHHADFSNAVLNSAKIYLQDLEHPSVGIGINRKYSMLIYDKESGKPLIIGKNPYYRDIEKKDVFKKVEHHIKRVMIEQYDALCLVYKHYQPDRIGDALEEPGPFFNKIDFRSPSAWRAGVDKEPALNHISDKQLLIVIYKLFSVGKTNCDLVMKWKSEQ